MEHMQSSGLKAEALTWSGSQVIFLTGDRTAGVCEPGSTLHMAVM